MAAAAGWPEKKRAGPMAALSVLATILSLARRRLHLLRQGQAGKSPTV